MHLFWIIFIFALGACVGSFLNVVIWRLPRGESLAFPGSHCPSCGRAIRWYDNIPLLSYAVLRARCRNCKVHISARYPIVEAVTALLVTGLYIAYYMLDVRDGAGVFTESWPMFLAHAILICGLLACAIVDAESFLVPLEICWFLSLVGIAAATYRPHPWMPPASPAVGAGCIAAMIGLGVSLLLQRVGILLPSFLDAEDLPVTEPVNEPKPKKKGKKGRPEEKSKKGSKSKKGKKGKPEKKAPPSVAFTSESGVNPRVEVLREVLFLAPAIVLFIIAYLLVSRVDALARGWAWLHGFRGGWRYGEHLAGFEAALLGYLVAGLWIWGVRILGTLGFGKEAMGLGDVHILAAVGAVTGWVVPSLAFFVAPFFGLLWAVYLWASRNQRELPYGPWLAAASLAVMLAYDVLADWLRPHFEIVGELLR